MSRATIGWLAGFLVLAGGVGSYQVQGQEGTPAKAAKPEDAAVKRLIYPVKSGNAKELAGVLGRHLKGDAEVEALPDPNNNCLLIRTTPAAFNETVKLLERLDRRPRQVAVELWIAELVPSDGQRVTGERRPARGEAAKPETPEREGEEPDFTGPANAVAAKIDTLKKKGRIGGLKHLQFAALENQPANLVAGETKPIVMSTTMTGTGISTSSITYRQLGTTVTVTPVIGGDKTIALDLNVQDAGLRTPPDSPALGTGEKGKPVQVAEFVMTTLKTKINVAPGQAVTAKDAKTTSKSQDVRVLLIVAARVVEP